MTALEKEREMNRPPGYRDPRMRDVGSMSLLAVRIAERGNIEGVPTTQIGTEPGPEIVDPLQLSPNYHGEELPGID